MSDDESEEEVSGLHVLEVLIVIPWMQETQDTGMNKKDEELARLRGKLEKKWGNDSDSSYAYLDPISGNRFPLTPFLMDEWVRGMVPILFLISLTCYLLHFLAFKYDGRATLDTPPPTTSFDPQNRLTSISPAHRRQVSLGPSSTASDVGSMTSLLNAMASVIGARVPIEHPQTPPLTISPTIEPLSPLFNTPSKLGRYLNHAEKQLGVANTSDYQYSLAEKGYSPDILNQVKNSELLSLGIPHGDVIHLKQGAPVWWAGPDARSLKRKAVTPPPEFEDPKKTRFEQRMNGEELGGYSLFGNGISPRDPDAPPPNHTWWYYCEVTQKMLKIPDNYVPNLAPGQRLDEDDS